MTTISKPIMTIANRLQELKVPTASEKPKEQTKLEEFIAKISLILHNLFTKGEFNIDLNDDNIDKVVFEIAVQCKQIIDGYNNPEDIQLDSKLDSKLIAIEGFPNIQSKFEIKDNKLNVTLIESNEYYYFPQEQLLLSIDLKDSTKKKYNLCIMDQVLSRSASHFIDKLKKLQIIKDVSMWNFIQTNKNIILDYVNSSPQCNVDFRIKCGGSLYHKLQSDEALCIDDIILIMRFYFNRNLSIAALKSLQQLVSDYLNMIGLVLDHETLNREISRQDGMSYVKNQLETIMEVLGSCCVAE